MLLYELSQPVYSNLNELERTTGVPDSRHGDFYNQVSHQRVNNVLESAGVLPERAKNIESFLSRLAAKQSRGLRVGPSSSIILAEAALDDVDKFLLSRGLQYVRYVDDFRIFCKSEQEAIEAAHDLTQYLYTAHRLALASSKTVLYTIDRFRSHELVDPEEEEERGKVSNEPKRVHPTGTREHWLSDRFRGTTKIRPQPGYTRKR